MKLPKFLLLSFITGLLVLIIVNISSARKTNQIDIDQKLDNGIIKSIEFLKNKDKNNDIRMKFHNKVKDVMKEKKERVIQKLDFESVVYSRLDTIYKDILNTSLFNYDGDINEKMKKLIESGESCSLMAEFVVEEMDYIVKRGLLIETILPGPPTKQIILDQVKKMKSALIENLRQCYPGIDDDNIIKSHFDSIFEKYIQAPDSILHTLGKRPLTEDQITALIADWKEIRKKTDKATSARITSQLLNITKNDETYISSTQNLMSLLGIVIRPMLEELDAFYEKNTPLPFTIPKRPANLKKLTETVTELKLR